MILITGGMGFIGTHTARRFLDMGEDVVITHYRVQRAPEFIADQLGKRLSVETIDVTSPHDLLEVARKHSVEGIVHLAVPGLNALRPAEEYRVNMVGLINVLEAARQLGMKRASIASSVAVYGSVSAGPFTEDAPLPIGSGGSTEAYKKAWEILCLLYAQQTGQDVALLRLGGIYGPLYHSMANLASRLCHAAVRSRPLDLAAGRGGAPFEDDAQDWCYVKDCALGIQLVQSAESPQHKSYNISGGTAVSNRALVDAVAEAVPGFEANLQPGRGARSRENPYMDIGLAKADVGYEPAHDINSGIADYAVWLKTHEE